MTVVNGRRYDFFLNIWQVKGGLTETGLDLSKGRKPLVCP